MRVEFIQPVVEDEVHLIMTKQDAKALHEILYYTVTVPEAIRKEGGDYTKTRKTMVDFNVILNKAGL